MSKTIRLGALLLGLALALAACGSTASANSKSTKSEPPFNVLVVGDLSNGAGPANEGFVQGMQAAALYLNKSGGITNHNIQFSIHDTGGDPTTSVTLVTQELQSQPKNGGTWNFIESGASSDEQLSELPTVTKYKVPGIGVESSVQLGNPTVFPYHWILGVNIAASDQLIAKYLKAQGYQKIGFFYEDNAIGQSSEQSIGAALKSQGLSEVQVSYPATAIDVTPEMQQMQAQHPDAVVATAQSGPWIGYVLKARTELGFNVPFVGDASFSGADAYTIAGPSNLNGVKYYTWNIDIARPVSEQTAPEKTFFKYLNEIAGTSLQEPLHQYAAGWDSMMFMNLAAKQAGSLDPDKIKDALDHLKIPKTDSPLITSPTGWGWTPTPVTGHLSKPGPGAFVVSPIGPLTDGQITVNVNDLYPKLNN